MLLTCSSVRFSSAASGGRAAAHVQQRSLRLRGFWRTRCCSRAAAFASVLRLRARRRSPHQFKLSCNHFFSVMTFYLIYWVNQVFRHSSDVLALRSCFPTLKLASALRALRRCFLLFISDLKSSLVVIPAKFYNGPWRPFQWGGARASLQIFAHGKYANPRSLSCFLQVEHLFKHHVFEHSLHTEAVSIQAKQQFLHRCRSNLKVQIVALFCKT